MARTFESRRRRFESSEDTIVRRVGIRISVIHLKCGLVASFAVILEKHG